MRTFFWRRSSPSENTDVATALTKLDKKIEAFRVSNDEMLGYLTAHVARQRSNDSVIFRPLLATRIADVMHILPRGNSAVGPAGVVEQLTAHHPFATLAQIRSCLQAADDLRQPDLLAPLRAIVAATSSPASVDSTGVAVPEQLLLTDEPHIQEVLAALQPTPTWPDQLKDACELASQLVNAAAMLRAGAKQRLEHALVYSPVGMYIASHLVNSHLAAVDGTTAHVHGARELLLDSVEPIRTYPDEIRIYAKELKMRDTSDAVAHVKRQLTMLAWVHHAATFHSAVAAPHGCITYRLTADVLVFPSNDSVTQNSGDGSFALPWGTSHGPRGHDQCTCELSWQPIPLHRRG